MSKKAQAVGEYILVEIYDPTDRTTKSGIILPASNDETPRLIVASKGSKVDVLVEPGDRIQLSEGIRLNCFYEEDGVIKLGVIHQKYIAAAWKE